MITQTQFDALAKLCRLQEGSATCKAVGDVMVRGENCSAAARKHGIHYTSVYKSHKAVMQAILLVHQAVTGELPK